MKRLAVAVSLVCWTVPALAEEPAAPEPTEAPAPAPPPTVVVAPATAVPLETLPPVEGAPRYDLVRINAGVRVGYVPNAAFDTFASNDMLGQLSLDGTYPLLTAGNVVLAAGVGWDVGTRSDQVRQISGSMTAHRLYVPIEGRYHFAPWLFGFGKVSPGAAAVVASMKDASAPNDLSTTGWAFSADASLGASILMGPRKNPEKRVVRFWLTPEVGYGFTTHAPLHLATGRDEKDLLGTDESTNLRSLALSGFFWRASVGTTF